MDLNNLFSKIRSKFHKKNKINELVHIYGKFPEMQYQDHGGYQSRNTSTITLIKDVFDKYGDLFDNKYIDLSIYTGDKPEVASKFIDKGPILAYSTTEGLKNKVIPIPDFIYTGWPEVGITTWEETLAECDKSANMPYEIEQCFWIGNPKTHKSRETLIHLSENNPELLSAIDMAWLTNTAGVRNIASKHVTIPDHAKYKSLIDIRGNGYSGRLKLLMHLKRPMFVIDRPYYEFFYPYMEPFKHFIPVKEDMSDLISNLKWLSENEEAYNRITTECDIFAQKYLSKDFAMKYLCDVICKYGIK